MRWLPFTRPPPPAFVCLQHFPVVIVFTGDAVTYDSGGAPCATEVTLHKHMSWHSDQFRHDDIVDPELLRRCRNIMIREQVRRYYPVDKCRLESFEGRTLVIPPNDSSGFLVGFAPQLMDAMHYVVTGDDKALAKPW